MIWIATLLLIAVAAWFIIEGNNERRWVEDHQHDETVAADKGMFPKYEELKGAPEPAERYSVANADGRIGRFAAKAREKTTSVGSRVENKVSNTDGDSSMAQKRQKRVERGNALTGPDSWLGKTAARLAEKTDAISEKIPEGRIISESNEGTKEPGATRRYINSITERLDKIDAKVKQG